MWQGDEKDDRRHGSWDRSHRTGRAGHRVGSPEVRWGGVGRKRGRQREGSRKEGRSRERKALESQNSAGGCTARRSIGMQRRGR